MATTPLWAKALQIPKALLDEWLTIAPIEESFTFWCLFTGRIDINAYFNWAKEQYGLAYLETGYFKQEPNRALWSQIHSVANWSPWMLPIEQWDGVVFVACVEPPSEHTWSFPVSYVLADPNQLEQLWQRLHHANDGTETVGHTATATATMSEVTNGKTLFDIPLGLNKAEVTNAADGPSGLNLAKLQVAEEGQTPEAFKKLGIKLDTPVPPVIAMPEPVKPEEPVGMPQITLPTPPPPQPAASVAPPAPQPIRPVASAPKIAPIEEPPSEPAHELNVIVGPIDIATAPDQISGAATDDACLAWFFKQLRSRFNSGVALVYHKNSLSGWKWDASVTPANPQFSVPFDGPSLFRISARTLRSYHGHVVDNPIHQAFFQAWGFAKPPLHVTAVPIIVGGAFHGLFVCFGGEPLGVDALEFAERIADQTIMQMEKINGIFGTTAA